MNKRRVVIRILKIYFFAGLIWLLLAAAILFIPSPNPEDSADSDLLNRGDVLTRVYDLETFYPRADKVPDVGRVRRSWRSHIAFDMKLEQAGEQYSLLLGARHDSLGFYFSRKGDLLPYQNISLSIPDKDAGATVSKTYYFTSRVANAHLQYGPINGLYWINEAERVLADWWLGRDWTGSWDLVTTPVRVRVIPDKQTIEVWPESVYWRRPDSPWNPPEIGAFATAHLADEQPSFTFNSMSASPSAFYHVRVVLVAVIVPVSFFFIGTAWVLTVTGSIVIYTTIQAVKFLAHLVSVILGIFALLGIIWWFRLGRPRVPWREIKDAVVEVMGDARQGRIALPPDEDLEAQRQAVADETAVPTAEGDSHHQATT